MNQKIDKNYLGETLSHLDINGDNIIEPQEWVAFFEKYSTDVHNVAKMLVTYILRDMTYDNDLERLETISENILSNNTDTKDKSLNLFTLYDYITRFIAPIKFRNYQQTLKNPQRFFLYDGILYQNDFDIFYTHNSTHILIADIYYLLVSYNLSPDTSFEIINCLLQEANIDYDSDNFTLNGNTIFEILAIEKDQEVIIDIDALLNYAHKYKIEIHNNDDFKLFDIHTEALKDIHINRQINYQTAYNFFNFHHKHFFKMGILSLLNALSIDLHNTDEFLNLISFLGYIGKPDKLFREISGNTRHFGVSEVQNFLDDNNIKYYINK